MGKESDRTKKNILKALNDDNAAQLCNILDEYKTSYGVAYLFEVLISGKTTHTIASVIELLKSRLVI